MAVNDNLMTVVEAYGPNRDGEPRDYIIAEGTSVSKGQSLQLTTGRTVVVNTSAVTPGAGVASEEHIGGQGVTHISVWTDIVLNAVASGGITVGDPVRFCEDNKIRTVAIATASGAVTVGYVMDALADGDTGELRLRL